MSTLCTQTFQCGGVDTSLLGEEMVHLLENIVRGCQMLASCHDRLLLVSYNSPHQPGPGLTEYFRWWSRRSSVWREPAVGRRMALRLTRLSSSLTPPVLGSNLPSVSPSFSWPSSSSPSCISGDPGWRDQPR